MGSIFHGGFSLLAGKEFLITQFHFSKTVAMRRAASFFIGLQKKITCRSIFEIGYCILGRGDAVGAGRELPVHPRVLALTNAASRYLACRIVFYWGTSPPATADCRGAYHLRVAKMIRAPPP